MPTVTTVGFFFGRRFSWEFGSSVYLSKPSQRFPRLLHLRLKRRVGIPPQLEKTGVVLDRSPAIALALVDLGLSQLGRSGVQEIVRQAPIPRQRLVLPAELVQELGTGEPLVEVGGEW